MIKSGVYTPSEGKLKYEMEANKVSFAYVAGLYSTIKDSDVKVTDAEILLHEKMKRNLKQRRLEVEYVLIADEASKRMRLGKERISGFCPVA
jgi:peptidyl-prolyl cis-trans isomerase D